MGILTAGFWILALWFAQVVVAHNQNYNIIGIFLEKKLMFMSELT